MWCLSCRGSNWIPSGLRHRLATAQKIAAQTSDHDTKIALARQHFGVHA
jgi:hypothetical protein